MYIHMHVYVYTYTYPGIGYSYCPKCADRFEEQITGHPNNAVLPLGNLSVNYSMCV